MSARDSYVERLTDKLLEGDTIPNVRVVDLGWGPVRSYHHMSQELGRRLDELGIDYRTPHVGACHTVPKVRDTVRSYLGDSRPCDLLLFVYAIVGGEWKEKLTCINENVQGRAGVAAVCLSREATRGSVDKALEEVAAAILCNLYPSESPAQIDTAGLALGDLVRRKSGAETPLVVVVCGDEKQERARREFPDRMLAKFGIEGIWIPTHYTHPEYVVDEIKRLYKANVDEEGACRIVGVLFSQRWNSSIAKDDAMAFLSTKKILASAPDFKSTGSALHQVNLLLQRYVGENPKVA